LGLLFTIATDATVAAEVGVEEPLAVETALALPLLSTCEPVLVLPATAAAAAAAADASATIELGL